MTNPNNNDSKNTDDAKTIRVTDDQGNVKEEFEVVRIVSGDDIQDGTFIIEVKPK